MKIAYINPPSAFVTHGCRVSWDVVRWVQDHLVMAQRFIACDREQSFLMPPDVREWLPARHLAWFVIDAVAEMDLQAFYAAYRVDGRSRPPYDPA